MRKVFESILEEAVKVICKLAVGAIALVVGGYLFEKLVPPHVMPFRPTLDEILLFLIWIYM
jgi:hypothetical protein